MKIWKRTISLLLVLVMCVSMCPVSHAAESGVLEGKCGETCGWTLDTATGELRILGYGEIEYLGSGTLQPWYPYRDQITEVVIEDGITVLPRYTFEHLRQAVSIRLPNTLESMACNAFNNCEALNDLVIPASVTAFTDGGNFNRCYVLTDIWYRGTRAEFEQIEGYANAEYYDTMTIHCLTWQEPGLSCPEHGKQGFYVYEGTDNTNRYDANKQLLTCETCGLPSSGTCGETAVWNFDETTNTLTISGTGAMTDYRYGSDAPWGKLPVAHVVVEEGITSIGTYAFDGCKTLRSVSLPEGLTTLGDCAFYDAANLTEIGLPESLTWICSSALGMTAIAEITIPENVTAIGEYAFLSCDALRRVTFLGSVPVCTRELSTSLSRLDQIFYATSTEMHYPAHNETWTEDARNSFASYGQTLTWVADHPEEILPGKVPTESAPGLTEGKKCPVCGEILVAQEEIPATGIWDGSIADAFAGGSGTQDDPYQIATGAQLARIGTIGTEGVYFIQTKDLKLNDISNVANWATEAPTNNWTPIDQFKGTYDGQDYTISGLYIMTTDSNVGLFRTISSGATVQNVTVAESFVSGESSGIGGVAGLNSGTVTNCAYSGTVSSSNSEVGGVVGNNLGTVTNCVNTATVSGTSYVGGVVGYVTAGTVANCSNSGTVSGRSNVGGIAGIHAYKCTIKNCTNTGDVTGTGSYIGGVVGNNGGTANGCTNSGTVVGTESVGGVAASNGGNGYMVSCLNNGEVIATGSHSGGIAGNNYGTVTDCVNTGAITGTTEVGGVVGCNDEGDVKTCSNTGKITGSSYFVGGVAGYNYAGSSVANCFNTGSVNGSEFDVGGVVGANEGTVKNSFNIGFVSGPLPRTGGVVGYNYDATVTNSYYLDTCGAAGEGAAKTAAQFASGEVAYLLNGDQSNIVWYQICGEGLPAFTGKTVYAIMACDGETITGYSNTAGQTASHSYQEDVTDPTCESGGYITYTCGVCGHSYEESTSEPIGHAYGDWYETVPPTCTLGGEEQRDCVNCGASETQPTPSAGHADVPVFGKEATCTEYGLTDGVICDVCGEILVAQEELPLAPHTEEILPGKAPGESTTGLTEGKKCAVCGEILVAQEEIPATGYWDGSIADAFAGGSGTQDDPYQIATGAQLARIGTIRTEGVYFVQIKDIKLNDISDVANWATEAPSNNWTPIPDFGGTFDGQNYTVSGLYINTMSDNAGLFGTVISTGTVQNVVIADSLIHRDAYGYIGSVVGRNDGTVRSCVNHGEIRSAGNRIGGAVGENNGTVVGCINTGAVIGNHNSNGSQGVGGVVGFNYGTVEGCSNSGSVTGGTYVGGVVGSSHDVDNLVKDCTNTGDVTGTHQVGGVVGQVGGIVSMTTGTIESCANNGTVSGNTNVGGVVGDILNGSTVENCTNTGIVAGHSSTGGVVGNTSTGIVRNCTNSGDVSGDGINNGGVVGHSDETTVENCSNSGMVSGSGSYIGGVIGCSYGAILNCANSGNVSGSHDIGGVVGWNGYGSSIQNCYSTGTVRGTSSGIGGITGDNSIDTVENCYYLSTCGAAGTGTAKTADQFASGEVAYLLNGDQSNIVWYQTCGEGLPAFSGKTVYAVLACDGETITGYSNTAGQVGAHSYSGVTTPPTCEEAGYITYTCGGCGHSYQETTDEPLGHKEETIPGKAATCTETGLTDGKKCTVCDKILVAQEVIAALGHKEEVLPGKAATCTETGLTDGKKCTVCGKILVEQEVIAALGHKEETIPGKAATCTETGLTDGKKCTVCGKILVAQTVIPARGHMFNTRIKPAFHWSDDHSCTAEFTCLNLCGETTAYPCTVKTDVDPGPDCKTRGKVTYTAIYGSYYSTTSAEGDFGPHTETILEAVAPTCQSGGWTEGSYCSVCEEILTQQQAVPALTHLWGAWGNNHSENHIRRCQQVGCQEIQTEPHTMECVVENGRLIHRCTSCSLRRAAVRLDLDKAGTAEQGGKLLDQWQLRLILDEEPVPTWLYAASYDEDGRLISTTIQEVPDEGAATMTILSDSAGTVRVFFVDETMTPWQDPLKILGP